MAVLSNPRHERFSQALAKGKTQEAAYIEAGYKPSRPNACKLASSENISQRVAEIQERGAVRAEITIASLTQELLEMKALLMAASVSYRAEDDGDVIDYVSHQHVNAARQCAMDAAKLNGLVIDKAVKAQVSPEELLRQLDGDD